MIANASKRIIVSNAARQDKRATTLTRMQERRASCAVNAAPLSSYGSKCMQRLRERRRETQACALLSASSSRAGWSGPMDEDTCQVLGARTRLNGKAAVDQSISPRAPESLVFGERRDATSKSCARRRTALRSTCFRFLRTARMPDQQQATRAALRRRRRRLRQLTVVSLARVSKVCPMRNFRRSSVSTACAN